MAISFIQGQYEYTRIPVYSDLWGNWGWYDVKAGFNETKSFNQSATSLEWVSGDSLCFTVNYTSGSNLGTVILDAFYGESRTLKDNFVSITYNGANSFTVKALKACSEIWVDLSGTRRSRVKVSAKVADGYKNLRTFDDMPDVVTDSGNTYSIVSLNMCFYDCREITNPPRLSSNAINMEHCFQSCRELSVPPVIPNSVTILSSCFASCDSLAQAPVIPSSVTDMDYCFDGCTSLTGNVVVYNSPTSSKSVFYGTSENIFIINKGSGETEWKTISSQYQNVHYEVDDNPIPNISDFTATRVSAVGSTDYEPTGLYAYIKANIMVYDNLIPAGWTNELKGEILTDNGTVESVTWQPSQITEYPTDIWCWISLGDTSGHAITLQISDSIKDNGTEVKTQSSSVLSRIITKSYTLVDYYHDDVTGTEGMSIGKYAEYPDLLDIDMPTHFRQQVLAPDYFMELDTSASSGTDKEIYDALVDLGWDSDVIV